MKAILGHCCIAVAALNVGHFLPCSIRQALISCSGLTVDIYDGEQEPMIFHGKTFTSKVSLREVCQTIAKYGFVGSPYPIIISAEVHCGLVGQDMIAEIMIKEFGDALVRAPVDPEGGVRERERIEQLLSPEELRGKILLKAKNLNLGRTETVDSDTGGSSAYTTDPSSFTDSDVFFDSTRGPGPEWTSTEEDATKKSRKQPSDSIVKGSFSSYLD